MGSITSPTEEAPRILSKAEVLLQENSESYLAQIAAFKPKPTKVSLVNADFSETDTVVGARIRPLLPDEVEDGQMRGIFVRREGAFVDVMELRERPHRPPILNPFEFQLHRAYGPEQTSEDVYEDLVAPLVPWSWGGGISTLFAYGQTGSGKTYTISELQRLVAADLMEGKLPGAREISISSFELAGQAAFDLLNDRAPLKVLEDSFGETNLLGITEHALTSAGHLTELVEKSLTFRKSASTFKNDSSSRSHAIWRIRIVNKDVPETPDGILFLIDLAGSEFARDYKTHTEQQRKESKDINVSLSTLKDCIRGRALQAKHVPFRSSALTKVLKHVFDPLSHRGCKTAILACVNPSTSDLQPSKNTLRFAELLKIPVPKAKPVTFDPEVPVTWNNAQLKAWIAENSGSPPISGDVLAPTESGAQLTRLPKEVFVTRCLLTPSVTGEQARAFYDKLWRAQIDAQIAEREALQVKASMWAAMAKKKALAEEARERAKIPFKERIRQGMFVKTGLKGDGEAVVLVLAPEFAFGGTQEGGKEVEVDEGGFRRFVCARTKVGAIQGAYEVDVGSQVLVGLREMEEEVLLEYDGATRFYFLTV